MKTVNNLKIFVTLSFFVPLPSFHTVWESMPGAAT